MQEIDQAEPKQFSLDEIKERVSRCLGPDRVQKRYNIITDTSDFFRVEYDDIVILGDKPYLIRNNEREGRFGIDEQQKFWVKRARDLSDGSVKIIKLVFHERFQAKVGNIVFECFRSPKKEARILDLTKGHCHFMQGFSLTDSSDNLIRVIDFVRGKTLADAVMTLGGDHEDYFSNHFPLIFEEYIELVEAIRFLHQKGEKHGDIRRDHIIKEEGTGNSCWIDFDFDYLHKENMFGYDLFGLGNILVYLTGRGDVTFQQLRDAGSPLFDQLTSSDMNIIFNNRVVNLKKVYPYIPDALNFILLHFSSVANVFYENTEQLLHDLHAAKEQLQSM
ncbi:MAG: hypothetical protein L6290_10055 [Thermodesulfovibrionales bacterium]|nr:hypothetical protein [Thermodesulfovibrionales bacterium]